MRHIGVLLFCLLASCSVQTALPPLDSSLPTFIPHSDGLPTQGQWKTPLAIGDVNHDGLLDIAAIGRKGSATATVWLNNGTGWDKSIEGIDQKFQCGVGVDLYDVNYDNHLDVLFAQHCGGPLVYLGDGEGNWRNFSNGLFSEDVNTITAGDLDHDGKTDIVLQSARVPGGFYLFELEHDRWERQKTNLPTRLDATPLSLSLIDVDENGLPDILSTAGKATIYMNQGNYHFTPRTLDDGYYLRAAHLDADNILDYIISGPELTIHFGDGTTRALGPCPGGIDVGDINNDGYQDIAANCKRVRLLFGPHWHEQHLASTEKPYGILLADLNRDSALDIVAATGNGLFAWLQKQ